MKKVAEKKKEQGYQIAKICGTCKHLRQPKSSGVRWQCGIGKFAVDDAGVCWRWI